MGLLGRGKDGAAGAEKDLATVIAKRGTPGEATITAMTATGQTRAGGAAYGACSQRWQASMNSPTLRARR